MLQPFMSLPPGAVSVDDSMARSCLPLAEFVKVIQHDGPLGCICQDERTRHIVDRGLNDGIYKRGPGLIERCPVKNDKAVRPVALQHPALVTNGDPAAPYRVALDLHPVTRCKLRHPVANGLHQIVARIQWNLERYRVVHVRPRVHQSSSRMERLSFALGAKVY